jgi:hypothetical protein
MDPQLIPCVKLLVRVVLCLLGAQHTPSVPLKVSLENRVPLTNTFPGRHFQWDGGSSVQSQKVLFTHQYHSSRQKRVVAVPIPIPIPKKQGAITGAVP